MDVLVSRSQVIDFVVCFSIVLRIMVIFFRYL
jgi:hypothetical protein